MNGNKMDTKDKEQQKGDQESDNTGLGKIITNTQDQKESSIQLGIS